jgi:hypothetical protein
LPSGAGEELEEKIMVAEEVFENFIILILLGN